MRGIQSPEIKVYLYSQLISTRVPSSHNTEVNSPPEGQGDANTIGHPRAKEGSWTPTSHHTEKPKMDQRPKFKS